jgi:putative ubiquitin-RnfH superfamily antitoxin RatB of RatAB toxin-antitoxin module
MTFTVPTRLISVFVALPDESPVNAREYALTLPQDATVGDALRLIPAHDAVRQANANYYIDGKPVNAGTALHQNDRIECLSPLARDPKDARRQRSSSPI